jgi:hypothetical protein
VLKFTSDKALLPLKNIKYIFFLIVLLNIQMFKANAQLVIPGMKMPAGSSSQVLEYDFSNNASYVGTGTLVNNLYNSSRTASLVNGPTYFSTPGYAYLDGVNDYLLTENLAAYFGAVSTGQKSNVFSINFWFNPKSSNGVILQEMGQTTPNTGYHDSHIEMVNGVLKFSVYSAAYTALISSSTLTLHNWYHVAMTYDGQTLRAYLNGSLLGSSAVTRISPITTTNNFYYAFGAADGTNLGSGVYGKFLLSKFCVYNSALNATDILSFYNQHKSRFQTLPLISLDAANTNSYAGSGTTWKDISGNANHLNLGATTYTAAQANGAIYFDGTDYIDFECGVGSLNTVTIEMWVNTIATQNGMYMGWNLYDVWTVNGGIGFNTSNSDLYGINSTQVNNLGVVGNWKHLVFVMNKSDYTLNKIYVNGVMQTLAQQAASQLSAQANFNGGLGRIACWRANTSYIIKMYLSTFAIYANELTGTAIQQRFTDTKSRYGL